MAEWVLFWWLIDPPVVRVSVEVYRSQEACEMAAAKIKVKEGPEVETECVEDDGPQADEPIHEYHVVINDSDPAEWE